MKRLGFHYHVPFLSTSNGLTTSSFLGVFIDSLADKCEHLVVFGYDAASPIEMESCNYTIRNSNVTYVALGIHSSVPGRIARGHASVSKIIAHSRDLDCLIVRAPTPLIPFFSWRRRSLKMALFIVGDYKDGFVWKEASTIRQKLIYGFNHWIDKSLRTLTQHTLTIVNSKKLYNKYSPVSRKLFELKTTTLSANDFFEKADWDWNSRFTNILYTGRILPEKRIHDILEACIALRKNGYDVRLHLAGNLIAGHENYLTVLKDLAAHNKFEHLYYHGLKKVGEELNQIYRLAHIYIIASGNEGFPRTVWEAMANSVPVIATNVGSIPYYLRDGKDALIIEPGAVPQMVASIRRLMENAPLRQDLIKNGFMLAKENTLEIQTEKLLNTISDNL